MPCRVQDQITSAQRSQRGDQQVTPEALTSHFFWVKTNFAAPYMGIWKLYVVSNGPAGSVYITLISSFLELLKQPSRFYHIMQAWAKENR